MGPRNLETIEMKFTWGANHFPISTRKRPVVVIKKQAKKNMIVEGKNPEAPVIMGRPSMPAPMQLPAIRREPPITLP